MKLRFPYGVANPLSGLSITERLMMLARYYVAWKSAKAQFLSGKADFKLVLLTSKYDLLTTQVSLATVRKQAKEMPQVVVACDSTLSLLEASKALDAASKNICLLTVDLVANFFEANKQEKLAWLCRNHVFGYKLAVCIMLSLDSRVLYADSDILWRADPLELMNKYTEAAVYGSTDYKSSYDQNLLSVLPQQLRKTLEDPPFINAGLAIFNIAIATDVFLNEVLSYLPEHFKMGHFTEQTILGLMAKQAGKPISKEDVEVVCPFELNNRAMRLVPATRAGFASHYVTPVRKFFWFDAAKLFWLG